MEQQLDCNPGQPQTGYLHSVQTLGTLDGPGVRFVAFMQGCPLRCGCCHNPDTWALPAQAAACIHTTPAELLARVLRCRPFFGKDGGVTISGGEPLLQQAFVTEFFRLCKQEGLHTCLDTSGFHMDAGTAALLDVTDFVLLDIKYTTQADYEQYVGCRYDAVLQFLAALETRKMPVWLRQVFVPSKNDDDENLRRLAHLARAHTCVQRVELLAFRKLCLEKYDALQLPFPFAGIPEATASRVAEAQALVDRLRVNA